MNATGFNKETRRCFAGAAAGAVLCLVATLAQADSVLTWTPPGSSPVADQAAAGNVASHLFNPTAPVGDNGSVISDVLAGLIDQAGVAVRPAVSVLPQIEDDEAWSHLETAQLVVMDPLTISVVNLPPPAAAGLALLSGLALVRFTRWFRPSRGG